MSGERYYQDEHEAFSASRSSDYVYVPSSNKYFKKLDSHVDSVDSDIRLPLVVLGENNIGKSSLLANWTNKREQTKKRDDFLFKHFVGSSPISLKLSNMLFRLETSLKEHFHLREMKLPESEDRLRWSLARYLSAAAKKALPAHLIIVIDGVNFLKSETGPPGALHWLPTELPPNVRVIVSTIDQPIQEQFEVNEGEENGEKMEDGEETQAVEGAGGRTINIPGPNVEDDLNEKANKAKNDKKNRTTLELKRRGCPELLMEPLGVQTRQEIVLEYLVKYKDTLELTDKHKISIVTARATCQPLYLRMLLYALWVSKEMKAQKSIDDLLELYLTKYETPDLIVEVLNQCEEYVDSVNKSASYNAGLTMSKKDTTKGMLGKILAAIYTSRKGLSDDEIKGVVELSLGHRILPQTISVVLRVLRGITFVVNKLRTFSHRAFRDAVYAKYIGSPAAHIEQHKAMAKYFSRFPPCARKLDALPYHLEVSGAWNKLRNLLVDVNSFKIWWTQNHKKEFILLWASLTTRTDPEDDDKTMKIVTGEFDETTMRHNQKIRPHFDIVDEYARSVEEYREREAPSDEAMGRIVLKIAQFLVEFALLGHEEESDVPNFIHPQIPNSDFQSLGVPYIDTDEDFNSTFIFPKLAENAEEDDINLDLTLKPSSNEDELPVSTYYYHRWMWISFPYLALANCGDRFQKGIRIHKNYMKDVPVHTDEYREYQKLDFSKDFPEGQLIKKDYRPPQTKAKISESLKRIATQDIPKLPIRKPTKVRITKPKFASEDDEIAGAMDKMLDELYADIAQYRYEHDVHIQQKAIYKSKLLELQNEYTDLERTYNGSKKIENKLAAVQKKEKDNQNICDNLKIVNRNLRAVLAMCERHPAIHPSLIKELEDKIKQDTALLREVQEQLWEEQFEIHSYKLDFPILRKAIQETILLHHEMLLHRGTMIKNLKSAAEENFRVMERGLSKLATNSSATVPNKRVAKSAPKPKAPFKNRGDLNRKISDTKLTLWQKNADIIKRETKIPDPGLFLQKFTNIETLEEQMNEMKQSAQQRIEELTAEIARLEKEMVESKNMTNENPMLKPTGGDSTEKNSDSLDAKIRKGYVEYKKAKEAATTSINLEQRARSGLKHVAEILGIRMESDGPHPPVHDLVHAIEEVLDVLQEDAERRQQQNGAEKSKSKATKTEAIATQRAPQLDEAFEAYKSPKARLPTKLVTKPTDEMTYEDEEGDTAFMSRKDVKEISQKNLKQELKKVEAKNKKDAQAAAMAA